MVRLRLEHSLTDLEEGPSCGGEGDSQRFNVARKLGSTRAQDAVVRAVEGIKVFGADRCPMVQQEDGSWVLNSHSLVTEVALEDENVLERRIPFSSDSQRIGRGRTQQVSRAY